MSRNRYMRRRKVKSGLRDATTGLPISREEYERRKAETLATDGIFIDMIPAMGDEPARVDIALSGAAYETAARQAAEAGMDLHSYMQANWQETLARIKAEKEQPPKG